MLFLARISKVLGHLRTLQEVSAPEGILFVAKASVLEVLGIPFLADLETLDLQSALYPCKTTDPHGRQIRTILDTHLTQRLQGTHRNHV